MLICCSKDGETPQRVCFPASFRCQAISLIVFFQPPLTVVALAARLAIAIRSTTRFRPNITQSVFFAPEERMESANRAYILAVP
jgi:hypothetical protein